MKKVVLTVLTMLMLIVPAYAVEDNPGMDQPIQQEQEKEPVVVASLDELQGAIEKAEDGDTIELLNCVRIISTGQSIGDITIGSKEKTIILIPADDFADQSLFYLYQTSEGISFENIWLSELCGGWNSFHQR